MFEPYGQIDEVRMISNGECSFVSYKRHSDAVTAILKMDNSAEIRGRRIQVSFADKPRFEAVNSGSSTGAGGSRESARKEQIRKRSASAMPAPSDQHTNDCGLRKSGIMGIKKHCRKPPPGLFSTGRGDWECGKCGNWNFQFRKNCNMCKADRYDVEAQICKMKQDIEIGKFRRSKAQLEFLTRKLRCMMVCTICLDEFHNIRHKPISMNCGQLLCHDCVIKIHASEIMKKGARTKNFPCPFCKDPTHIDKIQAPSKLILSFLEVLQALDKSTPYKVPWRNVRVQ
uniref:Uncharacterized protein n=1 Tax=Lotharella oceanica TaxID=641309 RepID=A0A7S2U008_9EUKA|mmetsp:Transcript_37719/g.69600  ORF Transcript_37719/g.69600 Transcript_37719/m.69600 type:complete len:285 (+) Transcript_37719:1097-1951(+)